MPSYLFVYLCIDAKFSSKKLLKREQNKKKTQELVFICN